VTLNWVSTLRENEAPLIFSLFVVLIMCIALVVYSIKNRNDQIFQNLGQRTWSSWLEQGGKKNAGEKSYKFFQEGYVDDVYTCQ